MSFADNFVARFQPWLTPDLETYLRAIALMFGEVELYAFDTDTAEGWTILFDPDRAPAKALPYLAQLRGAILPVGIAEPTAREWIKDAPNQLRGTPQAIFLAAQRKLTGGRLVTIKERDGDPDHLTVTTYTAQTPDPAGTRADILSVTPHDVILAHNVIAGQTWGDVKVGNLTWGNLKANYATWGDVASRLGGTSTYSRPGP
ncbi:MAG: phage tail protein [Actinomycetota bacterium]|nr:phage tail protein [Actinomycetota bacterium]